MTQEEAISLLRRYRRDVYRYKPQYIRFTKRDNLLMTCVYGRTLVDEIIRRIQHSTRNPIDIVYDIYSEFDSVLGESDDDHFETHRFASLVGHEAGNILRYLKGIEKGGE